MLRQLPCVIFFALVPLLPAHGKADTELHVSLMLSSGEQRTFFNQAARHFERRHSDVSIQVHVFSDRQYKQNLHTWLEQERFDVMYWHAGERLFELVREGHVAAIDNLWKDNRWDEAFPDAICHLVNHEQNYYAVPYSYYPWGIYYNRKLFRRLELEPPETWEDFLMLGDTLRAHGITPLSAGTLDYWPAAAWFDLISLRLHGPEFHRALLRGEVAYTDERVKQVLAHWAELIERDFFTSGHENRSWKNALPLLYRDIAGMMLIGNFAAYEIPERIRQNFSLFSFPVIDSKQPRTELTPTDVFFLPSHAADNELAQKFLSYMAEPQIQQLLNNESGMLPPHRHAVPGIGLLLEESQKLIDQAETTTQYFDRDTVPAMAERAIRIFQDFMREPDIDETARALEKTRQRVFEN